MHEKLDESIERWARPILISFLQHIHITFLERVMWLSLGGSRRYTKMATKEKGIV
jgi:hypothetical protein